MLRLMLVVSSGLALACAEPGRGVTRLPDGDVVAEVETVQETVNDVTEDAPAEVEATLEVEVEVALEVEAEVALEVEVEVALEVETSEPETVTPEVVDDTCTYHTDCYPERLCGRWETTGELRCSDPCAGASDCAPLQICSKVPGSIQVGYCQDQPAGLPDEAPCSLDVQCRSRLCADGACAPLCLDEAHCAQPNKTCHATGDLSIGLLTSVCSADPAGAFGNGQYCTEDGFTFDAGYCASGHCDLLTEASACAPICKSEADCAPSSECNMVLFAATERSDSVPYDPGFTQNTHDAIAACFTPLSSGTLADGSVCSQRGQCRSNKCLALLPGSNTSYCTSFCTNDAQCPANMACKLEALNGTSEWLAAAGSQVPGAWSLVRICKFD